MTTKNTINKLFFDIETGRADDYELFMPEFKEPKDGRSKSIEQQRADWESKLALSPLTGQVICYGYSQNDNDIHVGYIEEDEVSEKEILSLICEVYLTEADLIIGHNIKDFDLWFIYNRCRKHGITFPNKLYSSYRGRFTWNEHIIDTAELWGCGKYKEYISLDNLAKYFGLDGKDNNISKNFEQVWIEDRDKAIEHTKNDVLLAKQIYEKLN
jgi:DNA polymerase elongation subunit (family B)